MTTDRETAEVLRSWMQEDVQLNDAGVHRVLARLPDTPQRRHRWLRPLDWHPFAPGATRSADAHGVRAIDRDPGSIEATVPGFTTATGRTRLMFSPVKALVVGALAFALGGVFLMAQPSAQPSGPVPGAETRLEGTRVAVAQDCLKDEASPGVCTWTSGDARLTGSFNHAFVGDIISVTGLDGDFSWADATLEGPEGSWTGRLYISATDPSWGFVLLSGSGAYEGWQYVATGVGGNGIHDDWSGIIYEGELPPFGPPSVTESE